jgi:methylmalonyl-CoA mutase
MSFQKNESEDKGKEPLLEEFAPHTKEAWREAVDKLLKGKPYEKIMLTDTYDGITLQPIYSQEDWEKVNHCSEFPGFGSKIRHNYPLGYRRQPWKITQEINCNSPEECNRILLHDLMRGQNSVSLLLDEATNSGLDPNQATEQQIGKAGLSFAMLKDVETAFENVDIPAIDLQISAPTIALPITAMLAAYCKSKNIPLKEIKGCIGMDPMAELIREGSLSLSLKQSYEEMCHLTRWSAKNMPSLRTIRVNTLPYAESGANAVQEVTIALATAVSYTREMLKQGLHINTIVKRIQFDFSIGNQFFQEIAKFRAARYVWSYILQEFSAPDTGMFIHARTPLFNKSQYDMYVNMLRTTTEAFSAVMGSVDSICVGHFDETMKQADDFSRRIARNQQLILSEECHFDSVVDPAGGSWYIESMTEIYAEKIWKKFQEIEEQGGIFAALESGTIQDEIKEIAELRKKNLATRKDVFVGINMYANLLEKKPEQGFISNLDFVTQRIEDFDAIAQDLEVRINPENPVASIIKAYENGATLGFITDILRFKEVDWPSVEPLQQFRITELFEKLRNDVEQSINSGKSRPKVFSANIGNISQYKARADFSKGFLEVGGLDIVDQGGFQSATDAAKAAMESGADAVVICSTDDMYPQILPDFIKQFPPEQKPVFILAGFPKEHIDTLKKAGIDEFIYLKANAYQILQNILTKIGVLS